MRKKYPVVYICNYSENYNFIIGNELTSKDYVVLAHSPNDSEKLRQRQIELCDIVYVDVVESINIRMRIEIAYARVLGKTIVDNEMEEVEEDYVLSLAKHLAFKQNYDNVKSEIKKPGRKLILNPWMDENGDELCYDEAIEIYGKRSVAGFVVDILKKNMDAVEEMNENYERMMMYCRELHLRIPEDMSPESIEDFLEVWDEYDPLPELK